MDNKDKLVISVAAGMFVAVLAMWFGVIWIDDPEIDEKLTNTAVVLFFITGGGLFCWYNKP